LEWRGVAVEQRGEPGHEIVQVGLQCMSVDFWRACPAPPVPNAVLAYVARNVTDERKALNDLTEILAIRNVTIPLRRGALPVGRLPGGVVCVGSVSRHAIQL